MKYNVPISKILTGKPTGKRPLGRPTPIWEDNIRIYLKAIGVNTRNWFDSAQVKRLLENPYDCTINSPGYLSH